MNNTILITNAVNVVENLSERKEQEEWDTIDLKDVKQELLQLEKWREQKMTINKGNLSANKWQLQHTFEHLRNMNESDVIGPDINTKILDWVLAEEEDTEERNTRQILRNKLMNISRKPTSSQLNRNLNSPEAASPTTKLSSAYIERTLNKQLLNNLLLQRISNKFHKKKETKNTPSNLSAFASNYNNNTSDKNTMGEIFEQEVSNFQQKALSSFKNVGRQFGRLGAIIEQEKLLKEAMNSIHAPQGMRVLRGKNKSEGFEEIIEEQKHSISKNSHLNKQSSNFIQANDIFSNGEIPFKEVEMAFKNNFHKALQHTQNIQKKITQERIHVSNLGQQLAQAQETKNHQLNLLDAEEVALKKELFSKSTKQRILEMKNLSDQFSIKREIVTSQAKELCSSLSFELNKINEAIQKLQNNLIQAKIKKNTAANILKDLYINSLSSKSPSKDLIEIVKELLLLNEGHALDTSLFPSSLDKKSVEFLIAWGKLQVEIEIARDSIALHGKTVHESGSSEGQNEGFDLSESNISKYDERNQLKKGRNMNQQSNSQHNSFQQNNKGVRSLKSCKSSSPTSNQSTSCKSSFSPVNISSNYYMNCEDSKVKMQQITRNSMIFDHSRESSNEGEFLMDSLIESRRDDEQHKKQTYTVNQEIKYNMHESSSEIQSRFVKPGCQECQNLKIQYCGLIQQENILKKNEMKRVDYSKNTLILLFGFYEGQAIYNQHNLELQQSQANKAFTASFNFNQIPLKNTNRPSASTSIHQNVSVNRDYLNNLTFQGQEQGQFFKWKGEGQVIDCNHKLLVLPNSTIKNFQSKKYALNHSLQDSRHFRNNSCQLFQQEEIQTSPSAAYSNLGSFKCKKVKFMQHTFSQFSKEKSEKLSRQISNSNFSSKI